MYIIVGSDGREYGPVDLPTLQMWATQGRVTPGTLIRVRDTGEQLAANQLPFLQSSFHAPPYNPAYPQPGVIQSAPGAHSPAVAVLLSLFCMTGLGQIYNRQVAKGLVILVVSIALAVFTVGFSILITAPLAAIDAGLIGGRLSRGEAVTEWQWF